MMNSLRMLCAKSLVLSVWVSFVALYSVDSAADYLPLEDAATGTSLRVWANDGGEKIPREQIRAFDDSLDTTTLNSVWDGAQVNLFAARNEVVSMALVVDNNGVDIGDLSVSFDALANADASYVLETTNTQADALFDWRDRPIEVFVVEYLKIHGLSFISYATYDETHIPFHLQRPVPVDLHAVGGPNVGEGDWADRPYHDLSYPDIAIPIEVQALNGGVQLKSQESQIFWVDIYVPKDAPAGFLTGTLSLDVEGAAALSVPVSLEVYDFALPDERHAKSMVYIEARDVMKRYFTGITGTLAADDQQNFRDVMNRHFQLAWRHGISLFDANELLPDIVPPVNQPNIDWETRLTSSFYSADNGYAGPGADLPHDLFVIGSYGAWSYWWELRDYYPLSVSFDPAADESVLQSVLEEKTGIWEAWFQTHSPDTTRFLYVDDEPTTTLAFAERVAGYVENSPTIGSEIGTFITASPLDHSEDLPSPSIFASLIDVAPTAEWEAAQAMRPDRTYYMYNGRRPASGSFATDDDGVALRSLVWGQYKMEVERWFYWHSTYYDNTQGGGAVRDLSEVAGGDGESYRNGSETNVFKSAHTFGGHDRYEEPFGERGFNYGNGDGLLFYPGTDLVFPEENLGLDGPIASLRLKHWRRGVQDAQYLKMASEFQPAQVTDLVQQMIPEALWEIGVQLVSEPTYVHKAPSWSINPDDWETARRALAEIIEEGIQPAPPQITTQPESAAGVEGEAIQLVVVASGNPMPTYQWFKDDVAIEGAVFAALTLQPLSSIDAGSYSVVVSNSLGAVTSDAVTLTVTPALSAPVITEQPSGLSVDEGAAALFTVIANGNPEPVYQWLKNGVPIPGAEAATFSIASVNLEAAGDYSVTVSNSEGSVESQAVTLEVNGLSQAPTILVPPVDAHVLAGETLVFTVEVDGTPAPEIQWLRDGVALLGETGPTLSIVASRDDAGLYSVLATNSEGAVESAAAELTVGLVVADVTFIVRNATSLNNNEVRIYNALLGLGHSVNLLSDNADLIAGSQGSDLVAISGLARAATLEGVFAFDRRPIWISQSLEFEHMGFLAEGTSPIRVNNQQSITLVDTLGAGAGALMLGDLRVVDRDKQFVWSQPVASAGIVATLLGEPDKPAIFSFERGDVLADGNASEGKRMAWYANGYAERRWTDSGRTLFEQSIAWLLDSVQETVSAPVIISEPESVSAAPGVDIAFVAAVTGEPAPMLQWLKDGEPVSGATSHELNLTASESTAGSYQLVATNSEGDATSIAVTLSLELDTTAPQLISAQALTSTSVQLLFNEALATLSAESIDNYVIDPSVSVISATLADPDRVVLETDELAVDTSYVVSVSGVTDLSENSVAANSEAAFATAADDVSVALVVGSLSLSVADTTWRDKLVGMGYTVELFLDRTADSVSTAGHDAVLISGTARAARLLDDFVGDTRGVLVSELLLYRSMGMTGLVNGTDYGLQASQSSLELLDSSSGIGAGFALGSVEVTDRNRPLNWGLPGAQAQVLATVVGNSERVTVFAYDSGVVLADGELAQGKRLGWHDNGISAHRWTSEGEVLFEQALAWLLSD